ncbi:MAG: hypothetical protein ACRD7E_17230, partial [Bryobacteraceae bacterium]
MDRHIRNLGTLNIAFGAISAFIVLMCLIVLGGPRGMYHSFDDETIGLVAVVMAIFHLLLAAPCILGGIHLLKLEERARSVLIVT